MQHTTRKAIIVCLTFALVFGQFLFLPIKTQAQTGTSYHFSKSFTADKVFPQPLVIPPASWVVGKTAKDLADFIQNCDLVSKWEVEEQGWVSYVPGLEFLDFNLEAGRGYAVSITKDTLVYFSGSQDASTVLDLPRTSLDMDQYHFTLPENWIGKKASELISEIEHADLLSYYDIEQNGWISHVPSLPFNNFTLEAGRSYVVNVLESTSFNPGQPEPDIDPVAEGCNDLDGGKDYFTKSTVEYNHKTYSDKCNDTNTSVEEKYCDAQGMQNEIHFCKYGCADGACIPEAPTPDDNQQVCGTNGKTYSNKYQLGQDSAVFHYYGACKTGCNEIKTFTEGPTRTKYWETLGTDPSAEPDILKYKIKWFTGSWSPWYYPGHGDMDTKTNLDGTQRLRWAYFDDHTHMYVKCLREEEGKPDLVVDDITFEKNWRLYNEDFLVAKVCNIGNADMPGNGDSTVRGKFSSQGTFISYNLLEAPDLGKGRCASVGVQYDKFSYLINSNKINITFQIDDINQVDESNENNNTLTKTVAIIIEEPELNPGDLFKTASHEAVYYLGTDNKRYVFPLYNNSDYPQEVKDSWSVNPRDIKTVSQSTMESYAIGGNIVLRPGSKLIKLASGVDVYAVGSKANIHAASIQERYDLYGIEHSSGWENHDLIVTVPDAYFVNYTMSGDLNNSYPDGTLIKYSSDISKVYLIYNGYKNLITSNGRSLNKLTNQAIHTATSTVAYPNGQTIDKDYDCLTDMAQLSTCNFTSSSTEPKLNLSTSSLTPEEMDVLQGQSDVTFGVFNLDTYDSSEDIQITRFDFIDHTSKANILQYISDIALYDGNIQLNSPVNGAYGSSTWATTTIILSNPLIIPKDTIKSLTLKADVSSAAEPRTTHLFQIANNAGVTAFGNSSNDQVLAEANYAVKGTLVKIVSSGEFVLSEHATNPDSAIYVGGTDKVTVGAMELKSSLEDVEVQRMTFASENFNKGSLLSVIRKLDLYDGKTLIAEAYPTGTTSLAIILPSGKLIIPQGSGKTITLKASFESVKPYGAAESGDGIVLKLKASGMVVKGVTSNDIYDNSKKQGDYKTNRIYVFKSYPTLFSESLPTTVLNNGTQTIYKFGLVADMADDIAWHKISFSLDRQGDVDFSNARLYGQSNPTVVLATASSTSDSLLEFYIDNVFDGYEFISEGTIKKYVVKADFHSPSSNNALTIRPVVDWGEDVLEPASAGYIDSNLNNGFIWSDLALSTLNPTTTLNQLQLAQWVNGRLLKNFNSSNTLIGATWVATTTPVVEYPVSIPEAAPAPSPDSTVSVSKSKMARRLSGMFLLATENNGRIFWVRPTNLRKYEVTFGNIMQLFQDVSLGISNNDLYQIPININSVSDKNDHDNDGFSDKEEVMHGYNPDIASDPNNRGNDKMTINTALADKLKGYILLQVEDGGRIWYVDQAAKRWEVTWANVMNLFTSLALGITNSDLAEMEDGN